MVYAPVRSKTNRMQQLLDELGGSKDPLWLEVSNLWVASGIANLRSEKRDLGLAIWLRSAFFCADLSQRPAEGLGIGEDRVA